MSTYSLSSESENSKWGALEPHHIQQLEASGISPEVAQARGYRSVQAHEVFHYGFNKKQAKRGLLIPIFVPNENQPAFYRLRPDEPRKTRDGKLIKYEQPKGYSLRIDVPPKLQTALMDPKTPLIITEGEKKADSLCTAILREDKKLAVIDLPGVWGFISRDELGNPTFSNDLRLIPLLNRIVYLVYDADVMMKPQVKLALRTITDLLGRKGARVYWIQLPAKPGQKVGVDDFLAAGHTLDELLALASGPELERVPVPPIVELAEGVPTMKAAAFVHEGRAYLTTYLPVKKTIREKKEGDRIVVLQKPEVSYSQSLFVIRDDRAIFGEGGTYPLSDLPFPVDLPEHPPPFNFLDVQGVRELPKANPAEAFAELVEAVDGFMDFERSIASQRELSELVSTWVAATYLIPALSTSSYLWITGPVGSGKSKLLEIVASCAFLGQMFSAHHTTAALRDVATWGGTLCWDEAEALADPDRVRKIDPEKLGILLAGLRRGTAWAALREPQGKRGWTTVYAPVFCPRAFTATQPPREPLASRCIVLPLVRTAKPEKAHAQPRGRRWEEKAAAIRRGFFAFLLQVLPKVPEVEEQVVDAEERLFGRALDPWLAPLVAAKLLEDLGVAGLYNRIRNIALAYQAEEGLAAPDLLTYVVRALIDLKQERDTRDTRATRDTNHVTATEVAEKVKALMRAEDQDPDRVSPDKVGRSLVSLRLPRVKVGGKRGYLLTSTAIEELRTAYVQFSVPSVPSDPNTDTNRLSRADGPSTSNVPALPYTHLSVPSVLSVPSCPSPNAVGVSVFPSSQNQVGNEDPSTWPTCQGCRQSRPDVDASGLCPDCQAVLPRKAGQVG